jgi:hypothetical protein
MTWKNAVIFEDSLSGVTVDALTVILTLDTRMVKQLVLTLKNSGGNGLIVRVTTRTKKGGTLNTIEVNDVTIAAGLSFRYLATKFIAETIFSLQSAVAGNSTNYIIEYAYSKQ